MAALLSLCLLLLTFAVAGSSADDYNSKRATFIKNAIAQVEDEYKNRHLASSQENNEMSVMEAKYRAFKKPTPESLAQGHAQLKFEKAVRLAEKQIIEDKRRAMAQDAEQLAESYAEEIYHIPGSLLTDQEVDEVYKYCGCSDLDYDTECNKYDDMWRRMNGTCNNVYYPLYGAAGTQMSRLIPAQYEDGISRPRGFFQMKYSSLSLMNAEPFDPPYPSPRIISLEVLKDREINDTRNTLMVMQWGQFMDHDLDAMPEYEAACAHSCDIDEVSEESCLPFPIPNFDLPDSRVADYCHDFRRSLPACNYNNSDGYSTRPREHFNSITHFIDASSVYHSNATRLTEYLLGKNGELKMHKGDTDPKLPDNTEQFFMPITDNQTVINDIGQGCPDPPDFCFLAGDFRANEQLGLASMHTLWAREHNLVAKEVFDSDCTKDKNSDGTDAAFNAPRNFVASVIQHITYFEYLRHHILGEDFYDAEIGEYTGYRDDVNPNIPNVFASAAFRIGHSQVQPVFPRLDKNFDTIADGNINLNEAFFDSVDILTNFTSGGIDPILRGLAITPARRVDEFITSTLTQQLFTEASNMTGADLASLNIMRGRDHGLPPYNEWRNWALQACPSIGFIRFRDWTTKALLFKLYGSLLNVDLFVGGLAEEPLPGGVVGPTFGCIMAYTFKRLRDADWFWFENEKVFTEDQIKVVKNTTLARVICRNTDSFGKIPTDMFEINSTLVPCSSLNGDLKEELKPWSCTKFMTPRTTRPEDDTRKASAAAGHRTDLDSDGGTDTSEIIAALQNVIKMLGGEVSSQAAEKEEAKETGAEQEYNPTESPTTLGLSDEELMERLEALLATVRKRK